MKRRAVASVLAALVAGCGQHSRDTPREAPPSHDAGAPPVPPPLSGPERPVLIDMTDPKASCVFGYRGPVIDLGSRAEEAHLGPRLVAAPVEWMEREGTTWAAVREKTLAVTFFVVVPADVTAEGPADAAPFLEARVRGGAARTLSFFLNGKAVGAATVTRGETKVVAVKGAAAQPVPGENELVVKFSGIQKGVADPMAYLEWVRFGVGDPDPVYAAPTARDVIVSRTYAGQPGRALSLRGPGFARCEGWLPSGSAVQAYAALEGSGAADAEIRVVRDRVPPTVIGTLHLEATDAGTSRMHTWPVGDFGAQGTLGAVELSVVRATKGARVVFGAARVIGPPHTTTDAPRGLQAPARGVVLVVLSQLGAHSLPLYGGALATPSLSLLGAAGAIFDGVRATTGVANGVMGSMVTGLSARELGMSDGDAKLPKGATTIAEAVGQAGIPSAFFTANPLTSAAFGFDRGWSRFEAHLPTEEGPATRVFDAMTSWVEEHKDGRFLVVVHARGGHPPWDVPNERVKTLPPENYTGAIDPKHAAELLARTLKAPGSREGDADRERAGALYGAAMEAEDAAIGRLLRTFKSAGIDDTTTVIVTSDIGVNDAARVPYAESGAIDEAALSVPLLVRWAHEPPRAAHVGGAVSDEDVASTVVAALGLPPLVTFHGKDLRTFADDATTMRPLLATGDDRFSLRWGPLVTSGLKDREGRLCDVSLEPACVTDVRASYPLASRVLHATLWKDLVGDKPAFAREPASLDPPTVAALRAWGR